MRPASPKYEIAARAMSVALADTLLEHGFVRRSPTNYVLDCATHHWRVVFGPGVAEDPSSFREQFGVFIPEYERVITTLFPKNKSIAMFKVIITTHRFIRTKSTNKGSYS